MRGNRPKWEREQLKKRIIRLTKLEPHLGPEAIAERLECSHVTVRKVQRAAGIYVKRGPGGFGP